MLVVLKLHTDHVRRQSRKAVSRRHGVCLFLLAIVSGVVLYWPFTRRLEFGTIRQAKSRRVRWLDWHNLLGVITVVWALVVGGTGVINTWAEPMLDQWRANELASMVAPYAGKPPPQRTASLDRVVDNATKAAAGMEVAVSSHFRERRSAARIISPCSCAATRPLTSRLLKPVLLDGETAEVADTRDLPFYLKALFVSQPLHFGDYGGMPLKVIWALLDVPHHRRDRQRALSLYGAKTQGRRSPKSLDAPGMNNPMNSSGNRIDAPNWRSVFGIPIIIGLLSLCGLLSALLFESGRYFSWIAVGSPIVLAAWVFVRRRPRRSRE